MVAPMTAADETGRPGGRATYWPALFAILVLAFNLRPVAVSVGPVLTDISADLGMSGTVAGVLTSLPTICFAVFGALAPGVSRRLGMHHTVGLAIAALIIGQAARAWVSSSWAFLALSVLALAGMAMCNILLPALVRHHFPNRIGLATALYSLTMSIGVTLASIGTVPLALALGGWRAAFTAGVLIALAAAVCWLPMLRLNSGRHGHMGHRSITIADVARTRMGWFMAVLFGLQSAHAYSIFGWLPTIFMDAGMDQLSAGIMLGIATGVGIPMAFLVPRYAVRVGQPVGMFLGIMAFLAAGFLGMLLAPMAAPWLWSALLAIGTSSFPLILALLGMRSHTPAGTTALSGFTQSVGYTIAAFGPVLVGALNELTDSWTPSLLLQLGMVVPMTFVGVFCCRKWFIEDKVKS